MPKQWSEEKLRGLVSEFEKDVDFKLISAYIDGLDALQQENYFLQNQKQFITSLTHQLRTPLTSILWTIETMQNDTSNRVALNDLRANTAILADIIKKLTNLLDSGAYKPGVKTRLSSGAVMR